jgi:hypothetical protein
MVASDTSMGDLVKKEVNMICEYCKTELEMFDRMCSNCGRDVEYASRKIAPGIAHDSPTQTLVEEKIIKRVKINVDRVRTRVRFLYTEAEYELVKQRLDILRKT